MRLHRGAPDSELRPLWLRHDLMGRTALSCLIVRTEIPLDDSPERPKLPIRTANRPRPGSLLWLNSHRGAVRAGSTHRGAVRGGRVRGLSHCRRRCRVCRECSARRGDQQAASEHPGGAQRYRCPFEVHAGSLINKMTLSAAGESRP